MKEFVYKYKIVIIITLIGIVLLLITRSCSRVIENNIRQDIESSNKIENKFNVNNEYVIKHRNDWRLLVNYFLNKTCSLFFTQNVHKLVFCCYNNNMPKDKRYKSKTKVYHVMSRALYIDT